MGSPHKTKGISFENGAQKLIRTSNLDLQFFVFFYLLALCFTKNFLVRWAPPFGGRGGGGLFPCFFCRAEEAPYKNIINNVWGPEFIHLGTTHSQN